MIKTPQRALQPKTVKPVKNPSDIGLMFFYEWMWNVVRSDRWSLHDTVLL